MKSSPETIQSVDCPSWTISDEPLPVLKTYSHFRARNNILRIVPVQVTYENTVKVFNALIDDGSTISFIDKDMRKYFPNEHSSPVNLGFSGVNGVNQTLQTETLCISLHNQEREEFRIKVLVVDKINENLKLPDINFMKAKFEELSTINFPPLAKKPVQVLIGQNAPAILVAKKPDLYLGEGHPNVRFTAFGPAIGYVEPDRCLQMAHLEIIPAMFVEAQPDLFKQIKQDEKFPNINHANFECDTSQNEDIERLIQKLINNDDTNLPPLTKRLQSPKNENLENQIRQSIRKSKNGHIEVPIFWKNGEFTLRCNLEECKRFDLAQKQRIVSKTPQHWEHCIGELQKQVDYGAARIVSKEEDLDDGFYHPIVVVIRPDKESTPVRMCVDASRKFLQKDGTRKCFNDQLPTGTNLLNDISDVITQFMTKKVTLFCDLTKMFFNIHVPEHQRKFLRFVFNQTVYESTGWHYGLRASPYVTSLCLKLIAEKALKAKEITEETFNNIDRKIYMDDGVFAVDSEDEAIHLAHQLMKVFDSVHMRFCKFGSNSSRVLQAIPEDRRLTELNLHDPIPDAGTLGLKYHANGDFFTLNSVQELAEKVTKTEIMRLAGKTYDPNNFMALITIRARSLTQLIFQIPRPEGKEIPWKKDLEELRDDCPELIEQIISGYREIGGELMKIGQIPIPRLLTLDKPIKFRHLVLFGDGSTVAYGAVAYLKTVYDDNSVTVRIVKAAKKCTPIRRQTIPRIELMAALEAAKLSFRLNKLLKPDKITLFSDAIVVLFWILKSDLHRFSDWIQTRLTQIHELTKNAEWRHVESSLNPADLLSRGVKIREIFDEGKFTTKGTFWMEGPNFLKNAYHEWPRHTRELTQIMNSDEKLEVENSYKNFKTLLALKTELSFSNIPRNVRTCLKNDQCSNFPKTCLNIFKQGEKVLESLKTTQVRWCQDQKGALSAQSTYPLKLERYSSIHKAARILQFVHTACFKWLLKIKKTPQKLKDPKDMNFYNLLIKQIQSEGFRKEFSKARQTTMWPIKSLLSDVNALFDEHGILRANARLATCPGLSESERKPILLPHSHPMIQAILWTYHMNIGHGGSVSELMAGVKKLFYLPRMRQQIKTFLNQCIPCKRKYARPLQPHMGNLPRNLESAQIFERISLDMFGPVKIKRGTKTRGRMATEDYHVLVIVCQQIHAVHLEMCESLSTGQVLSALQRFVSRKRSPLKIRSDNFSSFLSSRKVICPEQVVNLSEVENQFNGPEWDFTVPSAPDTNLAETYVRLAKVRLDLDTKNRTFTRDQLSTLLVLAEESINNRPLTFISDDINDPVPVTANRLIKAGFHSDATLNVNDKSPLKYRSYYEEVLKFAEISFQKFIEEFKLEYKKYPKWKTWRENIKEGDLVVVMDKNPLRSKDWNLGLVTKIFEDENDKVVRKCLVRYKVAGDKTVGIYLRHTRNLIPLGLWHELNEPKT